MIKYIDTDTADEVLTEYYHHKTEAQHKALREALDRVPAADVVEVVRCADCRFLTFSDMYGECGKGIMGVVSPNDYCSRGERRDG